MTDQRTELDAALGTAPFVLPTVPTTVGQFWTFGRGSDDLPSLPALALQAHLLPHYEAFTALVERARPGVVEGYGRWECARMREHGEPAVLHVDLRCTRADGRPYRPIPPERNLCEPR